MGERIALTLAFKILEILGVVVGVAVCCGIGYCVTWAWRRIVGARSEAICRWLGRIYGAIVIFLCIFLWFVANWRCAGNYIENGTLSTYPPEEVSARIDSTAHTFIVSAACDSMWASADTVYQSVHWEYIQSDTFNTMEAKNR